jgi:putative lipoic acid-binding regulatory protein
MMSVTTTNNDKPKIDYPTSWSYRIVGTSEEAIRAHALALLEDVEHELVLHRRSSGGRYVSLNLSLVVQDEVQRLAIYNHFADHEAIRFVV